MDLPRVLKATGQLSLIGISATLVAPFQLFGIAFHPPLAKRLPIHYHRFLLWLIGAKVRVSGTPATRDDVLFISNHTTYIDILVLGSLIEVCFVAKHEVETWPFFGWLAKLQRTVFIDRSKRSEAHAQSRHLSDRIDNGDRLVIFPEGTSSDGNRVLPFKSALFSVAEAPLASSGTAPIIQPVSVVYTGLAGLPLGRRQRHLIAWYGDMELMPHLWSFLLSGGPDVDVHFHDTVSLAELGSRKAASAHCHATISTHVAKALNGHREVT